MFVCAILALPLLHCRPDISKRAATEAPEPDELANPGKRSTDGGEVPPTQRDDAAAQEAGAELAETKEEELRFRNGTRLKRISYAIEGAAGYVPYSWRDTELDVECAFRGTSDGETRCVPFGGGTERFLDAACTEVVLNFPAPICGGANQVPKYVVRDSGHKCVPNESLYELVPAPSDVRTRTVYAKEGVAGRETCSETPWKNPGPPSEFFLLGTPQPLTRLVKKVGEQRSDGIPVSVQDVYEDGAWSQADLEDADGSSCETAAYGELNVCRPRWTSLSHTYADANCTEPLVREISPSSDGCGEKPAPIAPPTLISEPKLGCANENAPPSLYLRGDEFTSLPAEVSNGMCITQSEPPTGITYTYYRRGAEYDISKLTPVMAREVGTGRLRVRAYYDDHNRRIGTDSRRAWDEKLQMPCSLRGSTTDDRRYCLPWDDAREVYADATCTRTVAATTSCTAKTGSIVSYSALKPTTTDPCSTAGSYYKLGQALSQTTYYEKVDGACKVASPSAPTRLFERGEEVPEIALASLKRIVTD